MAGTIPLKSQVPAKEPTKSKIKMAGVVAFRFKEILSKISSNLTPFLIPMMAATAAASNKEN